MSNYQVPTYSIPWPTDGLRRISVNSFGVGGANSHIILDDACHYLQEHGLSGYHHCDTPRELTHNTLVNSTFIDRYATQWAPSNGLSNEDSVPRLLIWSAADAGATDRMLEAYQSYYQSHIVHDHHKLERMAYTLAAKRSVMPWRTFAVVSGVGGSGAPAPLTPTAPIRASSEKAYIGFIFTGQGAQYARMGLDLLHYSVFEKSLRASDKIFASLGAEWSLLGGLETLCLPQCFYCPHRNGLGFDHAHNAWEISLMTYIFRGTASGPRHSSSPVQPATMYSAADRARRPTSQLRRLSCCCGWALEWRDRGSLYHWRPVPNIGLQGSLLQRATCWESRCYYRHPGSHDVGQPGRGRDSESPREAGPGNRRQRCSRCMC